MSNLTNINNFGGNFVRQSNFELLRIVAMLLVLIGHVDFFSIGEPDEAALVGHPISSLMRYVIQSLSLVCVNVYILISGYFGIKLRIKSVVSFIFMLLFWRVFVYAAMYGINMFSDGTFPIQHSEFVIGLIPGYNDWFVSAYILLMFISPFLNTYIEVSSCRRLWFWVLLYVGFQMCFAWIRLIYMQFEYGYSVLSFIGLYMIGAAIRKSRSSLGRSSVFCIMCYVFIAIAIGVVMFMIARYMTIVGLKTKVLSMFGCYNGAGVMLCSVMLFLGFKHMKLQNNLINKIAASAFAVYLFHMHPAMRVPYKEVCCYLFNNFDTPMYLLLISAFIVGVFIFAIGLDQIRITLWNLVWKRYGKSLEEKYTRIKIAAK